MSVKAHFLKKLQDQHPHSIAFDTKAEADIAAFRQCIPEAMTPAQIEAFRGTESSQTDARMWLARMSSQVIWTR